MGIPTSVCVVCSDGPYGYLDSVIVDPVLDKVNYLIVESDEFPGLKRLIPVEEIVKSTFRYILLECTLDDLSEFEPFSDREFRSVCDPNENVYKLPESEDRRRTSWTDTRTIPGNFPVAHESIPANKIVVRGSPNVFAADDKVGVLDEFMIEPVTHEITELLIRIGYFWGYKDVAVPQAQIEQIKADSIYLKVSKAMIESLPTFHDQAKGKNLL